MIETSIEISKEEFKDRTNRLLQFVSEKDLSGIVLFDRDYILYYTGFAFIPTERPMAFLMNAKGTKVLFVPRLEFEHAKNNAQIDRVVYYHEYPDKPHPMEVLKDELDSLDIVTRIGADNDGYPWIFGYRGPKLNQMVDGHVEQVVQVIEDQMMIKSDSEIALIKESVKWGHLAHSLLQRYTRVGATETSVSLKASMEATLTMLDTIGPLYRAQNPFSSGARAGYRGQIGRNAAIPHAMASNIRFQSGDVLVTGASAPIWGYNSELERTMIMGQPNDEQKCMFDHMIELQNTAFHAIKPGALCSDVDRAVRIYYEDNGLMNFWKHHTGHAIGLRYHEGPFLDIGDRTEIKPGMVFTVEPGLYVPNMGGFRHSDTVIVRDEGIERLTYYPRDFDSLSIQ